LTVVSSGRRNAATCFRNCAVSAAEHRHCAPSMGWPRHRIRRPRVEARHLLGIRTRLILAEPLKS
jgi:hypothetical protein